MSYRYFDWDGCPARVLFEDKRAVRCEIWDPTSGKLIVDEKQAFTESLGIDAERGLVDVRYVISEEEFDALVQQRLAERSLPSVPFSLKRDE